MGVTVAVLGATGLVGGTMIAVLETRGFPLTRLVPLASERSHGSRIRFRGTECPVAAVGEESFRGVDLALFACSNPIAREWAPVARAAGTRVIDNSSAFRYEPEVPLVVPEVNGELLADRPMLVANPNCSTIPITLALAALRTEATLVRVDVATYQSVSGAGGDALDAFERQLRDGLDGAPLPTFGEPPLAYNVVPRIDQFEADGWTREEMKVVWESRRILGRPDLAVTCTAVRVPVRVGHSAAVRAVFDRPVSASRARECWSAFPGLEVVDDPAAGRVPTPLAAAGRDPVLVGRARADASDPHALLFFCCSDNLRKGAALNAVQIAEQLAAGVARTT